MKLKKVLAVLMTSAMIMGSAVTTFAAIPDENDAATVYVENIEQGATVKAYQIVQANYNSNGFIGYSPVEINNLPVEDAEKPTSEEVADIAAYINSDAYEENPLKEAPLTDADSDGVYTGNLNPGYWVVLVRDLKGAVKVYNPMLVGVYYTTNGPEGAYTTTATEADPLDAESNWSLGTDNAWAKSSDVPFEKTAKDTANLGEEVPFEITTTIPSYGPEYTEVVFNISDSLTDLELTEDGITVQEYVGDTWTAIDNTENSVYTINPQTKTNFTISFDSEWILQNGGKQIKVAYNAKVTGEGVNEDSHDNNATLTYTNNPGENNGGKTDTEKVYTFDIDGDVTADIIQKVQPGVEEGTTAPLQYAEFTLYTDQECKTQYTNAEHTTGVPTAISDASGKLEITGLAAGTYYLKETKAPGNFTLNNTVYKIDISATIEDEELKSWDIIVTDMTTNNKASNSFTVSHDSGATTVTSGEDNKKTEIMNTELSTLPSTGGIGTTIFTIGGCTIMIAAAGLYFASRRKESK